MTEATSRTTSGATTDATPIVIAPAETRRPQHWAWALIAIVAAVQLSTLRANGQPWWCSCRTGWPYGYPTKSLHNSQHLFDAYSTSHLLHGVIFFFVIAWLLPRWPRAWQMLIAVAVEAAWELVENSPIVIDRYRAGTAALGYSGDSIINSLGDTISMALGFLLARKIGLRWSIALYVVVELLMLWWIRDNLTLNVLMLAYPIEAVKQWQMAG